VAADLGNFTGGFFSGYCIRRGIPVIRARPASIRVLVKLLCGFSSASTFFEANAMPNARGFGSTAGLLLSLVFLFPLDRKQVKVLEECLHVI
jgi:hypothetical protein